MPNGRMGPPLRSFAADAHDCIMVRVLGPTEYKVVARLIRARKRAPPLIVIVRTAPSGAVVLEAVKVWPGKGGVCRARLARRPTLTAPARADSSEVRIGTKKRPSDRTKKLAKKKRAPCQISLTKKAPYKGPGADSEEKREPVRDIDIAVVDSLKVLDPNRPIREADSQATSRKRCEWPKTQVDRQRHARSHAARTA